MKQFITISGYIIGIIGFTLSIYYYEASKKEKIPTFIVEPLRTEIINSTSLLNNPIKVVLLDSQVITKDLISIRFYFWNRGKEAIKHESILESIKINTDTGTRIVFHRIVKKSRDICKIETTQIDSNTLNIDFKILEENDGFTGEILVEGKTDLNLNISGYIESVKSFSNFPVSFYSVLGKTFLYAILALLALSMLFISSGSSSIEPMHISLKSDKRYIEDPNFSREINLLEVKHDEFRKQQQVVWKINNPQKAEKTEEELQKSSRNQKNILIILICSIAIGSIFFTWYQVKDYISKNPSNSVPISIRP